MTRLSMAADDREMLEQWVNSPATSPRLRLRARVVLALADGLPDREVARQLHVARQTVALWRRRVVWHGTVRTIMTDAPGRGRKPSVPADVREAVRKAWLEGQQKGVPRSVRDLARQFALSPATVHRTLKAGPGQNSPPREAPALASPVAERRTADDWSAARRVPARKLILVSSRAIRRAPTTPA